jgi:hypothetical protein
MLTMFVPIETAETTVTSPIALQSALRPRAVQGRER